MHEIKKKKICTGDPLIEYEDSNGIIHHLALHLLMYPGFSQNGSEWEAKRVF